MRVARGGQARDVRVRTCSEHPLRLAVCVFARILCRARTAWPRIPPPPLSIVVGVLRASGSARRTYTAHRKCWALLLENKTNGIKTKANSRPQVRGARLGRTLSALPRWRSLGPVSLTGCYLLETGSLAPSPSVSNTARRRREAEAKFRPASEHARRAAPTPRSDGKLRRPSMKSRPTALARA